MTSDDQRLCPITGQPLPAADMRAVISTDAAEQFATKMNDLVDTFQILNLRIAGAGNQPTPGRTQPKSKPPLSVDLIDKIDEHRETLDSWAASYLYEYLQPSTRRHPLTPSTMENLFTGRTVPINKLCRYPLAAQLVDECVDAKTRLDQIADPVNTPRIPIGECDCGTMIYALAGAPTVTCRACGEQIDVDARKLEMRRNISALELPRAEAREAARLYAGVDITGARIDQWVKRGKLTANREQRFNLYNVGTLIELAHED